MTSRHLPGSAFGRDDGSPDAGLCAALRAFSADARRRPEVLAALHAGRVLAPVVAVAGAAQPGRGHGADISVPLLEGIDGRLALPVFTGLAGLARWDPAARPVPVSGPRAAQVAAAEGAQVLVLDPAGPHSCVMEAPELRALLTGRGRTPAYDDHRLAAAVATLAQAEPAVAAAWLLPAVGRDARLVLQLVDAATGTLAAAVLGRLAEGLARRPEWADHAVRGVECALLPATGTPGRAAAYRRFLD